MNKPDLSIGSVQFGLDYGISNFSGVTQKDQVYKILNTAIKNNIINLDTSPLYGDAETILGKYENIDKFKIITKTKPVTKSYIDKKSYNEIRADLLNSLKCLNIDMVEGLIIHNIKDIYKDGYHYIFDALNDVKQQKLTQKIGASVYTIQDVERLLKVQSFDIIQLPLNLFSQNFIRSGIIEELYNQNIEIHVRSVFLQGVIFLSLDDFPSHLEPLQKKMRELYGLSEKYNMSLLDLALNFIKNQNKIRKLIIGVNSDQQLRSIIKSFDRPHIDICYDGFHCDNENITNPSLW